MEFLTLQELLQFCHCEFEVYNHKGIMVYSSFYDPRIELSCYLDKCVEYFSSGLDGQIIIKLGVE